MAGVKNLLTLTDVSEEDPRASIDARLYAILTDDSRLILLDGRGWTTGFGGIDGQTLDDVTRTAKVVVGPDGTVTGESQPEVDKLYWTTLVGRLGDAGVNITAVDLSALPHEVEISERLLTRLKM
jgi:hypothetical protein